MENMIGEMKKSLAAAAALLLLLCGAYPLAVSGLSRLGFAGKAGGSLVKSAEGKVLGSALLGQSFHGERYFHPRPSAAGAGYDAAASGGSNLGPTSAKLMDSIKARVDRYRAVNGLPDSARVPADAVMASGSGLDPEISSLNARLQSARVAAARGLTPERVEELVRKHTRGRGLGFLGEPGVNVLALNLALDGME
jgi:K+-transporting ATPase ATPase C chain